LSKRHAYQECRLARRLELDVARLAAITGTLNVNYANRMGSRIGRQARRKQRHSPEPAVDDVDGSYRGEDVSRREAWAKNRR
jgi:hypothetical protein